MSDAGAAAAATRLHHSNADTARAGGAYADCLWIVLCGVVAALVLRPFQDTPFVDDWVYAWSVQHLLAGDGLKILDWSSNPNFAHVLWGALFCLPGGFSFVALRISTWVAGLLGLCALHLLLRELGVARRESFYGVALLGLNPIFFVLAATFMTDVPFVAAFLWASFALVAALQRSSDRWLAAFVVFACIATAVRVVALATPIAAVLTLALQGGAWGRRPRRLLAAATPLVGFALVMLWGNASMIHVTDLTEVVGSPAFRRLYLHESLARMPELTLQAVLCAAGSLGIALLPLSAALLRRRTMLRALPVLAIFGALILAAYATHVRWAAPLDPTFTWTYGELGGTESLVMAKPATVVPAWIVGAVTVLGFVSSALVIGVAWRRLRAAEGFLAWLVAGHLGLIAGLWLFYDRYLLALLPLLVALVLAGRPLLRRGVLAAMLVLVAGVSFVGVRDHLAYNRALWDAVASLRTRDVPDSQIDAGYVVDGWLHFARPENAPRNANGKPMFPWLTEPGGLLPYQVANQPLPGWQVLESFPFERWLARSGAVYVLRRGDEPAAP